MTVYENSFLQVLRTKKFGHSLISHIQPINKTCWFHLQKLSQSSHFSLPQTTATILVQATHLGYHNNLLSSPCHVLSSLWSILPIATNDLKAQQIFYMLEMLWWLSKVLILIHKVLHELTYILLLIQLCLLLFLLIVYSALATTGFFAILRVSLVYTHTSLPI